MIFNEIKCHVNTFLGLVGRCIPYISPCVCACDPPLYKTNRKHDLQSRQQQPQQRSAPKCARFGTSAKPATRLTRWGTVQKESTKRRE